MTHELKIYPEYFDAVASGIKPFEVRKNDRGYKVGDMLYLREYDKTAALGSPWTGRTCKKYITYILDSPDYVKDDYVVLGLKGSQN